MGLEDLTGASKFIDDLVSTNPAGGDQKQQGDDHIRGIKNVLKNSFPNIDGAVSATDTELNLLSGVTAITAFIKTLLDDTTAAAAATTLGLGTTNNVTHANITGDIITVLKTLIQKVGSDVASAATLNLGDGNIFDVTGTTTITSIASKGVGSVVILQFDGALTLTHHATDLVLPGGANITTAAGDSGIFYEYATGDWRCIGWTPATGAPVVMPSGSVIAVSRQTVTAETTGTTDMDIDNSIPQQGTDGDLYISCTHNRQASGNNLLILVDAFGASNNTDGQMIGMALFQDATGNAIAAKTTANAKDNWATNFTMSHYMACGGTGNTTIKCHIGCTGGGGDTFTLNGDQGVGHYGGVEVSSITIFEIKG